MTSSEGIRVCLVSALHRAFDVRIYHKEAKTLARNGYEVTLVVPHETNVSVDGIHILGLPCPKKGLIRRVIGVDARAFSLAKKQRAQVYHLHDPELLPWGVLLRALTRAKVVYDVHEDYANVIAARYRGRLCRKLIEWCLHLLEWSTAWTLSAVVAATDDIARHFPRRRTVVVRNYPPLDLFPLPKHEKGEQSASNGPYRLIVTGGLTRIRGIRELVQAAALVGNEYDIRVKLLGRFESKAFEEEIRVLPGFERVEYHEWVPYEEVPRHLVEAQIGVVLFHPLPNHINAMPNKLFEYMAAELPTIASHFPLWREIIEGDQCGITVDPLDPSAIADAIEHLLNRPELRRRMGKNGQRAVREKYNWENEGKKLLALYEGLFTKGP